MAVPSHNRTTFSHLVPLLVFTEYWGLGEVYWISFNMGCTALMTVPLMNEDIRPIRSSGWYESLVAVPAGYIALH